ncbi:MAG: DNA-3-methyladenine glycosylase I [Sandaracinaceae bacterium]|nr:DNA-3-methyladenine glycosylase I [Sandaracinaceae bacterium]
MATRTPEGLEDHEDGARRCWWAGRTPDYVAYHDEEWGRPVGDDHRLYEKLCLEGFQSGLSWLTILRKREGFRRAFAGFDPEAVARFGERDVERLLADASIVRHRGKIEAAIHNASRVLEVREKHGSLSAFAWQFEPPKAERPKRVTKAALMTMAKTPGSVRFAKALKAHGFKFVGPTTAYAFMQAMGLVNDHLEGCASRPVVEAARARFPRP